MISIVLEMNLRHEHEMCQLREKTIIILQKLTHHLIFKYALYNL